MPLPHNWRPHGLIQDPGFEEPYQHARRSVDSSGMFVTDPKEYHTVHLFEFLFQHVLFQGPNFTTLSQVPPASKAKGVDTACDIGIKFRDAEHSWHILCFAEAKRARNTTNSSISDLEKQAKSYCEEYLGASGEDNVYACTLVGASARCWMYKANERRLVGMWDAHLRGVYGPYKDVGKDEDSYELTGAFNMMKSLPAGSTLRIDLPYSQIGATPPQGAGAYQTGYAASLGSTGQSSQSYSSSYAMPVPSNVSFAQYTNPAYPMSGGMVSAGPSTGPSASSFVTPAAHENSFSQQSISLLPEHQVTVRLMRRGRDIGENVYQFRTHRGKLEKFGNEFFPWRDPQGYDCMVYLGVTSGIYFWTKTLDPDDDSVESNVSQDRGHDTGHGRRRH